MLDRKQHTSGVYLRHGRSSAGDCWKRLDVHEEEKQHLNVTGYLSQLVVFGGNYDIVTQGKESSANVCKALKAMLLRVTARDRWKLCKSQK